MAPGPKRASPARTTGSRRGSPFPAVVLGAAILLTMVAILAVTHSARVRDQGRFLNQVGAVRDRIESRIEIQVAFLQATAALFASEDSVSGEEFQRFVAALGLERRHPWTGPIEWIGADSVVEAGGGSGETDAAVRREALERARDTGGPALSGRVNLESGVDGSREDGLLIHLPVYRDRSSGASPPIPSSVEERRAALVGFASAPLRTRNLFTGIVGLDIEPRVAVEVYDGTGTDPDALLHDSRPPESGPAEQAEHGTVETMEVAGRTWTLRFSSLPPFEEEGGVPRFALLVFLGVVLSSALFVVAKAQVRARALAERSERVRSEFFAQMSHELRTPINAIVGYNDLILSGVYGEVPEEQERAIRRGQRAAHHLVDLVSDILDLSKVEAGKMELEVETVRVQEFLDDLLTTIGPMARERGCELRLEDRGGPGEIRTDPRRLRQILMNLLSNATKFGAGGPVWLRSGPGSRGTLALEVEDEGPGIAPEDRERVFDEFAQGGEVQESGEGTGLGLPISRRLAELLGGRLEVSSEVGKGSVFRLVVPVEPPA